MGSASDTVEWHKPGISADALVAELDTELKKPGRDRLQHPFVLAVRAGKASKDQIAGWLHQFVSWADPTNKLIGVMYANSPDEDLRESLMENILEEEHGRTSKTAGHVELINRTLQALGWDEERRKRDEPRPETWAFRHWWEVVIRNRPFVESLCAVSFAAERQNPFVFRKVLEGLKEHYDLGEDALMSIAVHASEVEEEHGSLGPEAISRYATSEYGQRGVRFAVLHTADLYYRSYDVWKYY